MDGPFVIEPNAEDDMTVCSCCAGAPGLRGTVYRASKPVAIYFGDPAGMPNYPLLRLGLVTGPWEDGTQPQERAAVAFTCKPGWEQLAGPEIVPADPYLPGFQDFPFLGQALPPSLIADHKELPFWLALAHAIIQHDPRLVEIRSRGEGMGDRAGHSNRRVASAVEPGQSSS